MLNEAQIEFIKRTSLTFENWSSVFDAITKSSSEDIVKLAEDWGVGLSKEDAESLLNDLILPYSSTNSMKVLAAFAKKENWDEAHEKIPDHTLDQEIVLLHEIVNGWGIDLKLEESEGFFTNKGGISNVLNAAYS